MTLIQHQELSSAQASITFSSIPQTFDDLLVVCSLRSNRSGDAAGDQLIQFNGTTSGYSTKYLNGNGSSASGVTPVETNGIFGMLSAAALATTSTFSSSQIYIPNYRLSVNKSVSVDMVTENNGNPAYQRLLAGLWSNTAAITSLSVTDGNSAQLIAATSITLYGILKGTSNGVTVV
jgi:hypothetical protein